ncbi:MAG: flagellin [Lachnospiraceae bacterium]|nr:flagellin [Lachnospiraceae bacterium]
MVVQHNLTAMNSNRMLGITTGSLAKSTEKLSSGYKINRAADDAAGLSISEKMRRQVRGLTQATSNAQDGISSVQTAEGALAEVHDMLQRMDELATKAANGTMSESDRQNVQDEIDQLTTEIDRVAQTTKFNETYLLRGTNTTSDGTIKTYLNAKSAGVVGRFSTVDGVGTPDTKTSITKVSYTLDKDELLKIKNMKAGDTYDIGGVVFTSVAQSVTGTLSYTQFKTSAELISRMTDALIKANKIGVAGKDTGVEGSVELKTTGTTVSWEITKAFVTVDAPLSMSLHVGADSFSNNKIDLQIEKMNARGLGIEGLKVSGTSAQNATFALDAIADAINRVSNQRSTLGAIQNRLEHTITNLNNVVENTTSAESQIRDTDMATEMVRFSNSNILQQAGQSMLAQANQSNQGVLSLLS